MRRGEAGPRSSSIIAPRAHQSRKRSSKRKNYHSREVREHDEAAALRMIAEGMVKEGLRQSDLPSLPKGDPRKARIAQEVRSSDPAPPLLFNLSLIVSTWELQQTSFMPAGATAQPAGRLRGRGKVRDYLIFFSRPLSTFMKYSVDQNDGLNARGDEAVDIAFTRRWIVVSVEDCGSLILAQRGTQEDGDGFEFTTVTLYGSTLH